MADARRKTLGRSASTESTEYSTTMGRSMKKKKPKERWLLTRKTWRYMADAGRKLIPDGAQNRQEDIPKIEAYFQEVCKKEPRFLLWRKNSYPGALSLRKKRKGERRKGGSCRKAFSEDEVSTICKPERPTHLALIPSNSGGRFDLQKMKYDFLNQSPSPTNYLPAVGIGSEGIHGSQESQGGHGIGSTRSQANQEQDQDEKQLINMLEQYLTIADKAPPSSSSKYAADFNYQELVDKLQRHLTLASRYYTQRYSFSANPTSARPQVHFNGDHVQKSAYETLSRYFSQATNRDKVISDLLTDRKALEKLYFELRKTKGFRSSRGAGNYSSASGYSQSGLGQSGFGQGGYGQGGFGQGGFNQSGFGQSGLRHHAYDTSPSSWKSGSHPPPLIEIENETQDVTYHDWGIQTVAIPETALAEIEKEYKKAQAEKDEEERRESGRPSARRRSSVDNDDISQSVSDTIKRYLRMARKKSVDTDKVDRFKRVNYDRNLRNIKAKGEITKPGDDDGLNKGCQTNDDWILTYRDLKFDEFVSDVESRVSSSRSSIDIGVQDENNKSSPSSPPPAKSHSFLSHLLHGSKHDKQSSNEKSAAASAASAGSGGAAMQKSKSSSSVMHHGSRLMAKKIFRSRSKSQTRPHQAASSWTPQGNCTWTNLTGRQVVLGDTNLVQLTEIERKVLQKVALAKLQALNLGVAVKVPTENVGAVTSKPKRRPYLLKRKALTTSIFDTSRKESEKDGRSGGLVFGIPLTQCVDNDRVSRAAAGTSPFRSRTDELAGEEQTTMARHGSRSSFSSLIEAPRGDESGSCESLMLRERIVGSVPGLLDSLSCSGSTADLSGGVLTEDEPLVPNILNACFRHLTQNGLHTLGIFRVSTSKKRIRQLREDFDCGKETTLDNEQCPHDVATLLKEYLRDLPDPLLCRDLYHAFVHTQKIRNRRLQMEAIQHLIQLLPAANRDTLFALLNFLAVVARYSSDSTNESGEPLLGNKMDSNNLATVFAPNILHCIKPGSSKDSADRPEDRIDIINVVRVLIDHCKHLFNVSAELLDEIYVHMIDSHPEALDQLLNKKEAISAAAEESVEELDSESYSAPWTPTGGQSEVDNQSEPTPSTERRKTYSREEFLHEAAATGGPNVGMRIRHKDRIRERSARKRRDESLSRKKREDDSGGITSSIMSRLRGQKDDDYQYNKNRSSSLESTSSIHTDNDRVLRQSDDDSRRKSSPYVLDNNGVLTASLTIPVQTTTNQSFPLNLDDDIPYIEDAENGRQQFTIGVVRSPTAPPRRRQRSISGSDSSVASNVQPVTGSISLVHGYDSAVGSSATHSSPVQNTPPSVSSSIAGDAGAYSSPPSWASTPPTSPDSTHTSVNYIPDDVKPKKTSSPMLQKVSFAATQEVQQVKPISKDGSISKSHSTSTFETSKQEREPKFTPSITSIGNAVLRSKTADFERITKVETKTKPSTTTSSASSQKKYTKRRYTDSRHQTRHIPDSEALDAVSSHTKKEDKSVASQAGPVYKRRELISSVPSK